MNTMRKVIITCLTVLTFISFGCAQPPKKPVIPEPQSEPTEAAPTTESPSEKDIRNQVDQLLKQLSSEKYKDREEAQEDLEKFLQNGRGGTVLDNLGSAFRSTKDPEVKARVERILKPYNRWQITPVLLDAIPNILELVSKGSRENTRNAVEALQKIESEDASGLLLLIAAGELKDGDYDVHEFAMAALTKSGTQAVGPLIKALEDSDMHVRYCAAKALGEIRDRKAVEPLIEALKDDTGDCFLITHTDASGSVTVIIQEDCYVRGAFLEALGKIGDKKALQPLIEDIKDNVVEILPYVTESLKKITGQDFGEDHDKWKKWYEESGGK